MSRSTGQGGRNLTLTEELEKLEQSITLTLQEIDSNFSNAHRIVTTSILPIVEQYAKHSNDVWEGSKFWKQFFEASANVSLSGYEEPTNEDDLTHTDTTSTQLETPTDHGNHAQAGAHPQQHDDDGDDDDEDEFTIDSPTQVTGLQTTPKLPSTTKKKPTKPNAAAFRSPSPRKYTGKNPLARGVAGNEPSTPRTQNDAAGNAQSSPFQPGSAYQPSTAQQHSRTNNNSNNDPLMHRILDKNYRVQATPHTQRRKHHQHHHQETTQASAAAASTTKTTTRLPWDDSPQSSPAAPAPQLRPDLFSPAKPTHKSKPTPAKAPRTPGISILTPARNTHTQQPGGAGGGPTTSTGRQLFSPAQQAKTHTASQRTVGAARTSHIFSSSPHDDNGRSASDSNDDDDAASSGDELGISPPKTLQFVVPSSRLMQTPAREASRRIVEDLLLTAGAEGTEEIEGIDDVSLVDEPSPSVVRGLREERF